MAACIECLLLTWLPQAQKSLPLSSATLQASSAWSTEVITRAAPSETLWALTLRLVWERVRKHALSAGPSPRGACSLLLQVLPCAVKVCDMIDREEMRKELPTSQGCLYEASVWFSQCQK